MQSFNVVQLVLLWDMFLSTTAASLWPSCPQLHVCPPGPHPTAKPPVSDTAAAESLMMRCGCCEHPGWPSAPAACMQRMMSTHNAVNWRCVECVGGATTQRRPGKDVHRPCLLHNNSSIQISQILNYSDRSRVAVDENFSLFSYFNFHTFKNIKCDSDCANSQIVQ